MQNIFYDRLMLIMSYLKITSLRGFAKKVGISYSKLQSYQRGSAPSIDVLNNILSNIPHLSAEWLLTGQGNMIKASTEDDLKIEPSNKLHYFEIFEMLKQSQRQVDDLMSMLKQSDKQLDDVLEMYHQLLEREKRGGIAHRGNDAECADVG